MDDSMGKRLRDPVHGLITFDENRPIDMLAWRLIDTREFQRLRRIRQLGVSEFTFPSAVHTRFAHSIGVFHTARKLVRVLEREMLRNRKPARDEHIEFDEKRAEIALIAALLHDLGHGPFSHTFEGVQKSRGAKKRHEQWTADIIRNPSGGIAPLLEAHRKGFGEEVAALLEKEDPEHIYHAIVSSSLDADRLDYLRRDKLMTGTGAGGIDFDWLVENVRVAKIKIDAPDPEDDAEDGDSDIRYVQTFCLTEKALPAAEQFLLARYTLHQQVYFHKATRCVEQMIGKLLRSIAACAECPDKIDTTGLPKDHPLIRFFGESGSTIENYLDLDDAVILGALNLMSTASAPDIANLANRLRERRLFKTMDVAEVGEDAGKQKAHLRRLNRKFASQIAEGTVIVDEVSFNIYAEVGGDEEKMHKKLHILDGGEPKEISKLSGLVKTLEPKREFTRLYFADPTDRDTARRLKG